MIRFIFFGLILFTSFFVSPARGQQRVKQWTNTTVENLLAFERPANTFEEEYDSYGWEFNGKDMRIRITFGVYDGKPEPTGNETDYKERKVTIDGQAATITSQVVRKDPYSSKKRQMLRYRYMAAVFFESLGQCTAQLRVIIRYTSEEMKDEVERVFQSIKLDGSRFRCNRDELRTD